MPKLFNSPEKAANKSLVKCVQCKVKATMTGMKMHMKTVHANPRPRSSQVKNGTQTRADMFACDTCEYTSDVRSQ